MPISLPKEDPGPCLNRTPLSDKFISVYQTWNAAFVFREFGGKDPELLSWLFPKLFIPSVLGADSDNYLNARIWSLYFAGIRHLLDQQSAGKKHRAIDHSKLEMAAREWGIINLSFAEKILSDELPFQPSDINKWILKWIEGANFSRLLAGAYFGLYPTIIPKNNLPGKREPE